ncbi:Rv3235 family protein [Nocardioides mesophilus]|uniref:Uncharacterized protein n=1 Tax=Nocardioides mesophilus TaxID=433659 RepID=A0A7G9RDD3_9ACTN|nr:Rv3235 family protein [Nocardioides mesophilus]QNN53608.1 hypothetical protein H9L09_04055 [Nocardioides mesophilus]
MTTQPRLSSVPPHWHRPPEPPRSAATVTRILTRPTAPSGEVPPAGVQGALALDLAPALGSPAVPELSLVTDAATTEDEQAADVRLWAARFAQAVVEVTGGDRPVTQMLRWTSSRVYQDLERRVRVLAQTRSPGPRRRVLRPQVRSVHVCLPTARSAEVSVHVRYGQRSRALAARLELRGGTWTCTALQLG